MRGRQKGQTKRMSVIKDPVIAPYEIQVEEDQYVLIDTDKDKELIIREYNTCFHILKHKDSSHLILGKGIVNN